MDWPFGALPALNYGLILADPPWLFRLHSSKGEQKSPQAKYACMSTADIQALPVSLLAGRDCALIMWATAPMLPIAFDTLRAWGFEFKTAGAWAKQSKSGNAWAFGTGYVLRSAAEFFLVGTIGRPKTISNSVRNLIAAPVREHSRKPDDMHALCEQLFPGPRVELFAREQRAGWDCWGNETGKFGGDDA